ncbi:SDR family oxidoreductase [Verminephrobacter aporrectodeae subsp. tuberculatae]|uniref:SDR family oxidoreductase n=1 Tax=Verminephrobacter aporrectodeae subsp. tuberculatae TaxID=1110392 RepID=A0ABT3KPF2_9BURK|nr:SDR family oxidoreductase [Verminephrobacter aporrectodeae]MCW5221423.1 SDR family oxidoreductase [Verminephrobacter aporrectodeae subsp. tuberculatae]MCW5257731.1 SDR family oxidoreductase [Verminephrobacter aporrectodeae subsp. tuberculatae]MCW5290714.1 SDR family oxidoreductase [Verminephrobacter aporrectodeae subsp. tuberculatae]MCW5320017.1 SDR family oxidoreductase [Verminephrobacter aporrectodeae subsp. tuberculatae]MCW8164695.1 SDR family oxidoreductase [Verminephrobacter aporrectod
MTIRSVAAITGGAGHIGRAIARKLASRGLRIAILDKNLQAGQAFAAELQALHPGDHRFIDADLMQPESFAHIRARIEADFGRLDYLVNNAAFYDDTPGWGVPFGQEGYEAWLKVLRVNLLAPFFLAQTLHPLLARSDDASIVNIGTMYSAVGPDWSLYQGTDMSNPAAYSASKGGLLATTRWLATALAPKVRVNMVSPGGIERMQDPQFMARYKQRTPLGRMGTENDVAGMVSLLLSPEGAYITGQHMLIDGGWTAW